MLVCSRGKETVKIITSSENRIFRDTRKLAESPKERKRRGASLIEGISLVRTAIERNIPLELVVVSRTGWKSRDVREFAGTRSAAGIVIFSDQLFRQVSAFSGTGSLLAVIGIPSSPHGGMEGDILLLEGIQDPGNLGMILRSAAGGGMDNVFLSPDCADPWSPKVMRAGMGAHFFLSIHIDTDLCEAAREFPGTVVALDPGGGRSLYGIDMPLPSMLIVGSEGRGLSESLKSEADMICAIPMPGQTESLNAAAAASIGIFEMIRQRRAAGAGT